MTCPYLLNLTFIYIYVHDQYSIDAYTQTSNMQCELNDN